ncbi:hypothetical protein [Novosphingobium sp.]|uniref:hypothetical protein n=1 Tax=Novosphingobium sp. TaxID=1874826 RepID=UPI002626C3F9|nr:hypothetical protein [Novosphingobium sp.]
MPVIAYQSFNANSSTTHGLASMWQQPLTRAAARRVGRAGHQALVLPSLDSEFSLPVEGPANLRPIQALGGAPTQVAFGTQIALIYQNIYRAIGSMPDLLVCGELDVSNADFAGLRQSSGLLANVTGNAKACQCFTAFAQAGVAGQIKLLAEGLGFVIYSINGLSVLFVHVPNAIATNAAKVRDFYAQLNNHLVTIGSGPIDLVIGDTNQSSSNFTQNALPQGFANAHTSAVVSPFDNWNVKQGGTNSAGSKMFDVAVYNTTTINLEAGPVYLSQSSGAVTVTDHCGLAVKVSRKVG